MPLFSAYQLRTRAQRDVQKGYYRLQASQLLKEEKNRFSATQTYDIFLSHAFQDAEVIWGLRAELVDLGFSVYVDWIEDPSDRSNVTPVVAAQLRQRMKQCRSLLYATSDAAAESRWMPWELGYFDALKGTAAILPIQEYASYTDSYSGREYLGLYPYVVKNPIRDTGAVTLWVHENADTYMIFESWLEGHKPYRRR